MHAGAKHSAGRRHAVGREDAKVEQARGSQRAEATTCAYTATSFADCPCAEIEAATAGATPCTMLWASARENAALPLRTADCAPTAPCPMQNAGCQTQHSAAGTW